MAYETLLVRVERFLKRHKMGEGKFGRLAMGDSGFVFTIRNGRSPNERTIQKVDAFMKGYKKPAEKAAAKAA